MSKIYKVKVNQGEGKSEMVDVPAARSGAGPVKVKAMGGARYQLFDPETGYGPENIRVDRRGKDLRVYFEGRIEPDLVLEDYYEAVAPGFNALIGEAESGRFHEYIPESAAGSASVPALSESGAAAGLALGGLEVSPAGAAIGTLVAAAGFPWLGLLGAGAAAAAAAGAGSGGGGGAADDKTPPAVKSARLLPEDDSGPKDNVTQNNKPRITGETEANAEVAVTVNGKTYTGKADANGLFVIPVTDTLPDASYTPQVVATDAAGNKSQPFAGTPFRIDTSGSNNGSDPDANAGAVPDIVSISEDTGVSSKDFYTRDNTLIFKGTVAGFTENGAWIGLALKDSAGNIVDSGYAKPELANGVWQWAWDRSAKAALVDGSYTLEASVVDGAGNVVTSSANKPVTDAQVLTIDTDKDHNYDPSRSPEKQTDPNAGSKVVLTAISLDTGHSDKDFITSDSTLKFSGTVQGYVDNGGRVQLTLRNAKGEVIDTNLIKPQQSGSNTVWEWDRTQNSLDDGSYSLEYAVVDKAGNVLSSGKQTVVVDNSRDFNGVDKDPNAGLILGKILISEDTGRGGDLVTKDRLLKFSGSFDKAFVDNGDKLLVQVFGQDGLVLTQEYVTPLNRGWSFDNLVEFGGLEGVSRYTVSATLVDAAGNALQSTDQSFMVDTRAIITEKSSVDKGASAWTYSMVNFSSDERGTYSFTVDGKSYTRDYTGGLFDMKEVLGKTFAPGQFALTFTDLSGNTRVLDNTGVIWDFKNATMGTPDDSMPQILPDLNFSTGGPIGSVGKQVLEGTGTELDLSSLYTSTPKMGDVTARNHIDAKAGDHVIKLTMGDVLALGVKDSFSVAAAHKGKLQLRIDGDSKDVLKLDDLVGNTQYSWNTNQSAVTLDGRNYKVFSNAELGLDLFVEAEIRVDGP